MAIADVIARLRFDTVFSAADEAAMTEVVRQSYTGSATARAMYEAWIATPSNLIQFHFQDNDAAARAGAGEVFFDLGFVTDNSYIDDNGNAVEDTVLSCLVHELAHALTGRLDVPTATDYRGDNVTFANIIFSELGLTPQNSYIAYDSIGDVLTRGFAYTNGAAIDRSISGDADLSTVAAGASDDLLVGGASANQLEAGLGNDFLFGGGGDDTLGGGVGGVDTAVLTGAPVDYDIRLNADGTWTSRHIRGTADEGTDTFINLEKVQFSGGQTFNLAKSGLTFQNDIAFVIDQTGSMWDDIAAVKSAATSVVDAIFAGGAIDARVGIVGFRDNTIGEPTSVILPFTDQDDFAARKAAAIAGINSVSVSGGGDFPETAFDGLLKALDGSMGDWRVGAGAKKVALFTDASAKDAFLLPTVLAYATSVGATLSTTSSAALGSYGAVDTFELTFDNAMAARDPFTDGESLPPFTPSGDPIEAPGGSALIQVTTIFIDSFVAPDPAMVELSEKTGGSVLTAADPDDVVEQLLRVVSSANYSLSVDPAMVTEGDAGSTIVTFTLARDRAENAATVELEATGIAGVGDVSGAPARVSFAAGETARSFSVAVLGDMLVEEDETFGLRITDVSEAASYSSLATEFTILDDDEGMNEILGTVGSDRIIGTDADDHIRSLAGKKDIMWGGKGADQFVFGAETYNSVKERDVVKDYRVGVDSLVLEDGAEIMKIVEKHCGLKIIFEDDCDVAFIRGKGLSASDLTVLDADLLLIA